MRPVWLRLHFADDPQNLRQPGIRENDAALASRVSFHNPQKTTARILLQREEKELPFDLNLLGSDYFLTERRF